MLINILMVLVCVVVVFFGFVLAFGPYLTGMMDKRKKNERPK